MKIKSTSSQEWGVSDHKEWNKRRYYDIDDVSWDIIDFCPIHIKMIMILYIIIYHPYITIPTTSYEFIWHICIRRYNSTPTICISKVLVALHFNPCCLPRRKQLGGNFWEFFQTKTAGTKTHTGLRVSMVNVWFEHQNECWYDKTLKLSMSMVCCVFLYSKFQSCISDMRLIHSLGWLDCFWVDDLGYTSLKLTYKYSTWTSSTTPKRNYDELTNRTWSESKHIFVFSRRQELGYVSGWLWWCFLFFFRFPWVPWKKISADGIVWFNQFNDPPRTTFGVQRTLESQNPKGTKRIFSDIGIGPKRSHFFIQVEVIFVVGWGFLDVDGTFGPFLSFAEVQTSQAARQKAEKEQKKTDEAFLPCLKRNCWWKKSQTTTWDVKKTL